MFIYNLQHAYLICCWLRLSVILLLEKYHVEKLSYYLVRGKLKVTLDSLHESGGNNISLNIFGIHNNIFYKVCSFKKCMLYNSNHTINIAEYVIHLSDSEYNTQ